MDNIGINKRLFNLLLERGIEQKALADHLGVAQQTVNNWGLRGTDPPAKFIMKICTFLNISLQWLLSGEEQEQPDITPEIIEVIGLWNKLSPRDKAFIKADMYLRTDDKAEFSEEIEITKKTLDGA